MHALYINFFVSILCRSWNRLSKFSNTRWWRFTNDGSIKWQTRNAYQTSAGSVRRPPMAQGHGTSTNSRNLFNHELLSGKSFAFIGN